VGAAVGVAVGATVGEAVGAAVRLAVGAVVGTAVGLSVGAALGAAVLTAERSLLLCGSCVIHMQPPAGVYWRIISRLSAAKKAARCIPHWVCILQECGELGRMMPWLLVCGVIKAQEAKA
jgi:hypothetical protein